MVNVEDLLYSIHPFALFTRKFVDREVENKQYLPLTCIFHASVMKELLQNRFPDAEVKLVSGFAGWRVSENDDIAFDPENTGKVLNESDKTFSGHAWVTVDGIIIDVMPYTFPLYMQVLNSLDGGQGEVSESFPFAYWLVAPKSYVTRKEFFSSIPELGSFFYEESDQYKDIVKIELDNLSQAFDYDQIGKLADKLVSSYKEIEIQNRMQGIREVNLLDMVQKYKKLFFDAIEENQPETQH